jgi:filamentous hemagglutinin family protein
VAFAAAGLAQAQGQAPPPFCTGHPGNPRLVAGSAECFHDAAGSTFALDGPAVFHWDDFSVPAGTSTRFHFADGANGRVVLNRVTGLAPTRIDGRLESNGRVIVINPQASITVGAGASVVTAGFFASTLDLAAGPDGDAALLAGAGATFVNRSGRPNAPPVIVLGSVVSAGGDVALVGGSVDNGGQIDAQGAAVRLAAGRAVEFTPGADEAFAVEGGESGFVLNRGVLRGAGAELSAGLEVTNAGLIETPGSSGRVFLRVGPGNRVVSEDGRLAGIAVVNGEIGAGAEVKPDDGDNPVGATPGVRRFPALASPGSATGSAAVVAFTNRAMAGVANSARPPDPAAAPGSGPASGPGPEPQLVATRGSGGTGAQAARQPKLWLRASNFFGLRSREVSAPAR